MWKTKTKIKKFKCKGCRKLTKRRVSVMRFNMIKYCDRCKDGGYWRSKHRESARIYGREYSRTHNRTTRLYACCKKCKLILNPVKL